MSRIGCCCGARIAWETAQRLCRRVRPEGADFTAAIKPGNSAAEASCKQVQQSMAQCDGSLNTSTQLSSTLQLEQQHRPGALPENQAEMLLGAKHLSSNLMPTHLCLLG